MTKATLLFVTWFCFYAAPALAATPAPALPPGVTATQVAAPSPLASAALDALPKQVVGVVGSGDQISLQVKADDKVRTVKIGEVYADGWTLKALTPAVATFAKDGRDRQVGLNPTGVVGQAPAAPVGQTTVQIAGQTDTDIAKQLKDSGRWDGQAQPGLTLDETQKLVAGQYRLDQYMQYLLQTLPGGLSVTIDTDTANIPGYDSAQQRALTAKVVAAGGQPGRILGRP